MNARSRSSVPDPAIEETAAREWRFPAYVSDWLAAGGCAVRDGRPIVPIPQAVQAANDQALRALHRFADGVARFVDEIDGIDDEIDSAGLAGLPEDFLAVIDARRSKTVESLNEFARFEGRRNKFPEGVDPVVELRERGAKVMQPGENDPVGAFAAYVLVEHIRSSEDQKAVRAEALLRADSPEGKRARELYAKHVTDLVCSGSERSSCDEEFRSELGERLLDLEGRMLLREDGIRPSWDTSTTPENITGCLDETDQAMSVAAEMRAESPDWSSER